MSIVEKLHRESIRLSQVQDIAGCRIVVPTIAEQEKAVELLRTKFTDATVVDRREKPSHGYRAIHVIPQIDGMPVEVQLRTSLQHLWAELSEKLSDLRDPSIKYGGGPQAWQLILQELSQLSWNVDKHQRTLNKPGKLTEDPQELRTLKKYFAFWRSLPDRSEIEWATIEDIVLASYGKPNQANDVG
jgi:ppGpp synthetase/RelA/SpoT-type nucleotidyltranferase